MLSAILSTLVHGATISLAFGYGAATTKEVVRGLLVNLASSSFWEFLDLGRDKFARLLSLELHINDDLLAALARAIRRAVLLGQRQFVADWNTINHRGVEVAVSELQSLLKKAGSHDTESLSKLKAGLDKETLTNLVHPSDQEPDQVLRAMLPSLTVIEDESQRSATEKWLRKVILKWGSLLFFEELKKNDAPGTAAWRAYLDVVFTRFGAQLDKLNLSVDALAKAEEGRNAIAAQFADAGPGQETLRGLISPLIRSSIEEFCGATGIRDDLGAFFDLTAEELVGIRNTLDSLVTTTAALHTDVRQALAFPRRWCCQLPPAATQPFVGREVQKVELIRRLGDARQRLISVLAPAGLGKTALSAEALHSILGPSLDLTHSPFPDGIVFVDLYSMRGDSESAWNQIANSLEGTEFLKEKTAARERAEAACRRRRLLVVIEGAEEADGSSNRRLLLPELLEVLSSENRILVLTRNRRQTKPSETIELGDALTIEEAGALFDEITKSHPVQSGIRERVLRLLDGHPLAITWAANLMAVESLSHPPAHLVDEWEAETLPPLHDPDPMQAEHTLRWLFDRSVRDLDAPSCAVLVAFGLLARSPVPISSMSGLLGLDQDAHACTQQLIDRSILRLSNSEASHVEFTHALGYRFARLEVGSPQQLRIHLGNWLYQELKEKLHGTLREEIKRQITILISHTASLMEADQHDPVLARPLVLFILREGFERLALAGDSILIRACSNAAAQWIEGIPEENKQGEQYMFLKCISLQHQADVLMLHGETGKAIDCCCNGLTIVESNASETSEIWPLWSLVKATLQVGRGRMYAAQGNLEAAMSMFEECADTASQIPERDDTMDALDLTRVIALLSFVELAGPQGQIDRIKASISQAFECALRLVTRNESAVIPQLLLARVRMYLGQLALKERAFEEAEHQFNIVKSVAEKMVLDDASNATAGRIMSNSLNCLGELAEIRGETSTAQSHYAESRQIVKTLVSKDPSNVPLQVDLARVARDAFDIAITKGDSKGALEAATEILTIFEVLIRRDRSNVTFWQEFAKAHFRLGMLHCNAGRFKQGIQHFRDAMHVVSSLRSHGVDAGEVANMYDTILKMRRVFIVVVICLPLGVLILGWFVGWWRAILITIGTIVIHEIAMVHLRPRLVPIFRRLRRLLFRK